MIKIIILILVFIVNGLSNGLEKALIANEYADFKLDYSSVGKSIDDFQYQHNIVFDLPYHLRFEDFKPMSYIIILLTSSDPKEAMNFLRENNIGNNSFAYQFDKFSKYKYRIVYGNFKTEEEAKKHFKKLPNIINGFSNNKPYISRVALSQLEYYKFKALHE